MSAIGDYIHFSQQGYIERGVSRKGEDKAIASLSAMKERVALLAKQNITFTDRQKTQKILNDLSDVAAGIMDSTNPKFEQQRRAIMQYLQKEFGEKIQAINWETGTVQISEEALKNGVGQIHGEYGAPDIKGKKHIQLKGSVENLAKKIDKLCKVMTAKIETLDNENDAKTMSAELKTLKDLYQQTFTLDQETESSLGIPRSKEIKKGASFSKFRDYANILIQKYAALPPIYLYEGTLWEAIIAAIPTTGARIGLKAIYQSINESVTGNKFIEAEKTFQNFLTSKTARFDKNGVNVSITEDLERRKVDTIITWQQQELNISAKNIRIDDNKSYKWVSAVSDTTLMKLLRTLGDKDTINILNHYFNMYTLHSKALVAPTQEEAIANSNQLSKTKTASEVNDAIKAYLFFGSLTGTNRKDVANVFAIHNKNKEGKESIKFVLMDDLIQQLAQKTNQLSVTLNGTPIKQFYYPQTWVPQQKDGKRAEYTRIAEFTQELHTIKVKAKFNIVGILT